MANRKIMIEVEIMGRWIDYEEVTTNVKDGLARLRQIRKDHPASDFRLRVK